MGGRTEAGGGSRTNERAAGRVWGKGEGVEGPGRCKKPGEMTDQPLSEGKNLTSQLRLIALIVFRC